MKKASLVSAVFFLVLLFVLSCSKGDRGNITSEKTNTIVSNKNHNTLQPLVEDDERKWGERLCGDSTTLGTACDIIGRTCKYHTCNAGIQIERALSEKEISDYAKKYAEEQVEIGFIKKEDKEITIALMKSGLRASNRRFK